MFGLDEWIAGVSDEGSIAIVLLVATLLGLRHATDPDHLAAVSTLVVSGRERATRAAARLGAAWGLGHAVTLVAFGVPILLAERYLPDLVQRGAETTVAALIAFLAVRLLVRWRHGAFAAHGEGGVHRHPARTSLSGPDAGPLLHILRFPHRRTACGILRVDRWYRPRRSLRHDRSGTCSRRTTQHCPCRSPRWSAARRTSSSFATCCSIRVSVC